LWNQVSSTPVSSISRNFTWKARIDPQTGLASSIEESTAKVSRNVNVKRISEDFVATWPDFICQGSVTLGLFEAKRQGTSSCISIRPRCIPINLLTFGMARPRNQRANIFYGEIPIEGGVLALPTSKDNKKYGKLTFSVTKQEQQSSDKHYVFLKSKIVNYRPWLVGRHPSKVRQRLYLSTQSVLHAYITWRFHKSWQAELK
jgi:hypothetical protein